jgi:hypothetical protein
MAGLHPAPILTCPSRRDLFGSSVLSNPI